MRAPPPVRRITQGNFRKASAGRTGAAQAFALPGTLSARTTQMRQLAASRKRDPSGQTQTQAANPMLPCGDTLRFARLAGFAVHGLRPLDAAGCRVYCAGDLNEAQPPCSAGVPRASGSFHSRMQARRLRYNHEQDAHATSMRPEADNAVWGDDSWPPGAGFLRQRTMCRGAQP